jgi:hypothetical protein
MQKYDLCPNLKIAKKFLDFLDPGGSFTFQLFDDDHSKRDRRLAVMLHGTLKDHWNEICRLQNQDAGVYVTVNQTDLKGRKKENITRVRSVYVDLDDAPIDPVLEHELEPHCIVESSENKWHAYWRCDIDKEDFTALQKTLIKAFGGDKSVNDLPRVLRLPGCYHLKSKDGSKAEPFMTRIEQLVDGIKPYRKHDFEKYFEIADGIWGRRTQAAAVAFAKQAGLPTSEKELLSEAFMEKLASASKNFCPKVVKRSKPAPQRPKIKLHFAGSYKITCTSPTPGRWANPGTISKINFNPTNRTGYFQLHWKTKSPARVNFSITEYDDVRIEFSDGTETKVARTVRDSKLQIKSLGWVPTSKRYCRYYTAIAQ